MVSGTCILARPVQSVGALTYRTKFIDYDANYSRAKTDFICIACQHDLNPKRARFVHCVNGGPFALHPDDESKYVPDRGDMGCFPIGPDCAKKLGLEWTHVSLKEIPP